MKQKFEFYWEKQRVNIHNLPVTVKRNSTTQTIPRGHLMCGECKEKEGKIFKMKQRYVCPNCGEQKTIGQIKTKYLKEDDGNLLTYNNKEYRMFMDIEEGADIVVLSEIKLSTLPYILPVTNKDYEFFSNEDKSLPIIQKVFQYLTKNQKMLLVTIGTSRQGIIYPSYDRLILYTLGRIPKQPNQLSLPFVKLSNFEEIKKVYQTSEDKKIKAFNKFLEFKKSGKEIKPDETPKPVIEKFASDLSGLDMDEQSESQKEKELVI